MENYVKGEVKEVEDEPVFQDIIVDGAVHMKVKAGSKIRNLISFAVKKMQEPTCTQIIWGGCGSQAVTKAITCAELIKRKFKGLHQVNDIRYKRIEEYWEPKTNELERLRVNRDVPAMTILLSKEPLSPELLGYQGPAKLAKEAAIDSVPSKTSSGSHSSTPATPATTDSSLKRKKKPKFRNGKKGNTTTTTTGNGQR